MPQTRRITEYHCTLDPWLTQVAGASYFDGVVFAAAIRIAIAVFATASSFYSHRYSYLPRSTFPPVKKTKQHEEEDEDVKKIEWQCYAYSE